MRDIKNYSPITIQIFKQIIEILNNLCSCETKEEMDQYIETLPQELKNYLKQNIPPVPQEIKNHFKQKTPPKE